MGNSCEEESKVGERPEKADDVDDNGDARLTKKIHSEMGWVRKLEYLPVFRNEILDNHLIKGSSTVPIGSTGPKAFRNKKQDATFGKRVISGIPT